MNKENEVLVSFRDATINNGESDVVYDVNLEVKAGDFVYITGKVGGGKTSFAKTMMAENRLLQGEGCVMGYDLREIRRKQIPALRKKIGLVFQDFELLLDKSVDENLEFVLRSTGWKDKDKINERIDEVLELVGMQDKSHKLPYQLSGGQKQRICIARAILNSPALFIADEPTTNLDNENTKIVMELLKKINDSGTAVIIITHRTSLFHDYPGKVYICEDEKFAEKQI